MEKLRLICSVIVLVRVKVANGDFTQHPFHVKCHDFNKVSAEELWLETSFL